MTEDATLEAAELADDSMLEILLLAPKPDAVDVTLAIWLLKSLEMLDTAADVNEDRLLLSLLAAAPAERSVRVVEEPPEEAAAVAESTALLMIDWTPLMMEIATGELVA